MKYLLFIALFVALCGGQTQPTQPPVSTPPTVPWFGIAPAPPEKVDVIQNMVNHAAIVFKVIHEQDQAYCENGPTDPVAEPMVKRCDGAI